MSLKGKAREDLEEEGRDPRGGGGGSSPTKERVLGAESGGALKREGLQGPGCGEEGVRSGRTRTDGPVLTEGLQAEEALAGSRGVSSREAAASSSEPTSPARPPAPLLLRAATSRLPSHRLPREGARLPRRPLRDARASLPASRPLAPRSSPSRPDPGRRALTSQTDTLA